MQMAETERMELTHVRTTLEILAVTWGIRLTPEELEWLSKALKERAEQKRREAQSGRSVPAGYWGASEPLRPSSSSLQFTSSATPSHRAATSTSERTSSSG